MKNYNTQKYLINGVKYEENVMRAQVLLTEKFTLLTQPKICSSYIGREFRRIKQIHDNTMPWVTFNSTDLSIKQFNVEDEYPNHILTEIKSEWEGCLSKKSKNDILLLGRDPMKRFASAFYQDIIRDIINPKTEYKKDLLLSLLKSNISEYTYNQIEQKIYLTEEYGDSWIYSKDASGVNMDIARVICNYALNDFQQRNLSAEIPHNTNYMYKYYHIIKSDLINPSKIKFVDIGEVNLSNFLNRYDIHNFPKSKDNNSMNWKSQIYHVLLNNFPELYSSICKDLQYETYFYNIIKEMSNYVKNENI